MGEESSGVGVGAVAQEQWPLQVLRGCPRGTSSPGMGAPGQAAPGHTSPRQGTHPGQTTSCPGFPSLPSP